MRKKKISQLVVIIFVASLFFFLLNFVDAKNITGETITGKQIYGESNISIVVDAGGPLIIIFSPRAKFYHNTTPINLTYYVSDISGIDRVWYNINNGTNITLTGNTTFNINEGNYTLYLYANDSLGNLNSSSVNFFVNNSQIVVSYENFRNIGETTDFDSLTNDELQNLTNMTLETNYGKIKWFDTINIKQDFFPDDNETNLDTINLSYNYIYVNETQLPNLNARARIFFYNLTFYNPRILRNNVVCPPTICTIISYTNGTLEFEVTGFTSYSTEETTAPPNNEQGSNTENRNFVETNESNISSERFFEKVNFSFYPKVIKIYLRPGENKKEKIKITNLDNSEVNFYLNSTPSIAELVNISENKFKLRSTKEVALNFYAPEDIELGTYTGNIIIASENEYGLRTETIDVTIIVTKGSQSKIQLPKLETPSFFKIISPFVIFLLVLIAFLIYLKCILKRKN